MYIKKYMRRKEVVMLKKWLKKMASFKKYEQMMKKYTTVLLMSSVVYLMFEFKWSRYIAGISGGIISLHTIFVMAIFLFFGAEESEE